MAARPSYQFPGSVIQVFCKAPVAGQVKTRLMPTLTAEQAAQIHIELTQRLLILLDEANLCPVQLWCSPSPEHDFFQQQAQQYSLTLQQQSSGGLGKRMETAFTAGLKNFRQVLLVGCDCPSLTIEDFQQAFIALNKGADVVFAPAEDGGYVLIAAKHTPTELFTDENMPWGSSEVLAMTRERAKQARLICHEIRVQWDVDTAADFFRYSKVCYS